MGRCRFVEPRTVRLALSGDDWLEVKEEITRGELEQYAKAVAGDAQTAGRALVMAYLVDWSLEGPNGKPVPIADSGAKWSALGALRVDDYREIEDAVSAHVDAMAVAKKNSMTDSGH